MMKSTRDVLEELDLSFLSSDEEMAIRQVLQRDENLKRQESGRIRRLRLSIPDPKKLKILTGEWFEELRTRRYGRQSDVTEVVRSSMRRKKTPVPRGSPYRDTRKTDFKGEDVKTDSQTKTSEFKTLNSSFLNPAFREEKVELELTEEGSAADSDVTTVDIPEKKTPPFQKACEQTSRLGISPNPPLSTQHPDIDYFHTAYPDRPSPKPRTIKRSSFPVEAVAPMSQSTLTTQSDPSPPPKPGPEPLDDITYLESARILVLPPEIKDDPEQRSPTVSVDPNTWTQPVIEDPFIDVKVTDKSPEKTPTVGTLPGVSIQGRLEQRLGATMGERITSERVTSESLSGDDTERSAERSEERPNAGRGVEGADHSKLTSRTPPVEGAMQAGRHHLEEVPSEPYNMKHDPKPEEDQSYSESCLRSLRSSSEYNPFCTNEAPIPVEGPQQPAQEIAQVSVELKTWKQVDGDFMQVNLADEEQTPAKTPEGVTLPSANTQGMSDEQFSFDVVRAEFPSPSVGIWERSSRIRPQSKKETFLIGERVTAVSQPACGMGNRPERLVSRSNEECSDHSLTKLSSRTPPIGGSKEADPAHLEEVLSFDPKIGGDIHPIAEDLGSPKPEETQNDSELSFSLLQSTPAYNPFFTTDQPIFVRSPQLSIGEEPQSMKPMDQPSLTDDSHVTGEVKHKMTALSSPVSPPAVVPSVNEEVELSIPPADVSGMDKDEAVKNLNKDLDPDPEVVGDGHDPENNQRAFAEVLDVRKLEHDQIPQGMSEQQLVVENSEFQFVPTPSVGMWEGSSRMKPWLKQDNVTEETVSTKTPFVSKTQTRSVEKLNTERDVECSAGTKSSSTTPPAEGGKPAGQHHLEEVPSEPYNLRSPKPEEPQNDSELSFSLLQSTPAYNPFFTTDEPIFVRSPQLSIGEEPQSMKPMDQPSITDYSHVTGEVKHKMTALSSPVSPPAVVPSVNEEAELSIPPADISGMDKDEAVNNPNKDLDPDPEVVGDGHDPENNQRVFAEVLDVRTLEHVEIPVQVEIEESPESQTGAIATAPIAVNAQEMEGPKEEATSENEMFFIADSIADAVAKSSKVPAEVSTQQANQQAGKYPIPTILVNSSQSPITEEVIGLGHKRKVLEVSSMSGSLLGNLEDDTMESDDDHSSVSSRGSDFSDRRGYGSTLSLSGRTGSMLSVYSDAGDFGNVTVQGAVEFALKYSEEGEFIVTVEQCLDLAFANARKQRTDPYVKTYLHPDKSHSSKKKTSIKKRTTNPVYGGETLKYKIKMEELRGRTLNLSVWHNDSLGRNVFLGQVEINLNTWDWGHEALTWYNLQPKSPEGQEVTEHHGLLTVALKYLPPGSAGLAKPDSGEIHVWLKEARELRRLKAQGVDSFVKCYMLPDTSKKSRQKTRVIKKTQEPVYNHAMVYDGFRDNEVREACCELTVWDQNKLSNQFLGGVRLSLGTGQSYGKKVDWMDSWDQEIELWEKMLASPTSWVEGEIPLRSAMTPRKKRLL